MSFTTEEIFKLLFKNKKSIHLENFKKIPKKFSNNELDHKWSELKKIREICNISIEQKRASKDIGSSLEANLTIELDDKSYKNFKHVDFAELCITSSAFVVKNQLNEINVITKKSDGDKCSVCWKLKEEKCDRDHCGLLSE